VGIAACRAYNAGPQTTPRCRSKFCQNTVLSEPTIVKFAPIVHPMSDPTMSASWLPRDTAIVATTRSAAGQFVHQVRKHCRQDCRPQDCQQRRLPRKVFECVRDAVEHARARDGFDEHQKRRYEYEYARCNVPAHLA
jgi:hypothetical protein